MKDTLRPGYKQTEVGVIPSDWEVVNLERITAHIGDGLHGTPIYSQNGDYSFVNGNNLNGGKIVLTDDTKSVDYSEFIRHRKPLSSQSILLSINGTIGNLALFDGEQIVLGKSTAYLNIRPEVCKRFIYYSLQTGVVRRQFFDGLTGSTIGNLGLATIRKTQIPLPSTLAEQRAIAAALSDVDALLAKLDQLIAKKRDLKQAAMQQLLTGQTRLPGFSGAWEVKRLGDVFRFQVGFPFTSDLFNQKGHGIRLVKNRDLKADDQLFFFSGIFFDDSFIIKNGDVLIGMDGDFIPCLWSKGEAILNQRVGRIVPSPSLSSVFSYYMLVEPLKEIEFATSATTVKHLSHVDVEGIERALPGIEEQTAIAAVLSDMDAEITALEARRDKTRALKQGMMQELLTGRIRLV